MIGADPDQPTAARYRAWGRHAGGAEPLYAELCEGVAGDRELLAFLDAQPPEKRQPNLLLAAVRFLFGTQRSYAAFRAAVLDQRDAVATLIATRRTQTNEPGRCATLLPALAALPQPLALLEVGAAAGLCLLPDRYAYAYVREEDPAQRRRLGSGEPTFPCRVAGPLALPDALPRVVWRAGIDLAPIDLRDGDEVRWLEALVWPSDAARLDRLRAAVALALADPPPLHRGDLVDLLAPVAAEAPHEATLVVFHTAVLAYLPAARRVQFAARVRALGRAAWLSNEAPGVLAAVDAGDAPAADEFLLVRDGTRVLAQTNSHGRHLRWRGGVDTHP